MADYRKEVREIEEILNSVSKRKIKNSYELSKGLLFRLRLKFPLREIPVFAGHENYSWSNFRYWTQKLRKMGKLEEIERIARSD